jgi:hypothetical protein
MAGKVNKCTMHLECRLTETELKDSSKKLAEAIQRHGMIEERMEAFKTQNKAEMAEVAAIIGKHSALINNEKEFRMVPCEVTYDFKAGTKTFVRLDTAEIVKYETISDQERQIEFDDKLREAAKP